MTRTIRQVRARGEDFRVAQVQGNLIVCAKNNGSCCCGWTEKGRAPVNTALYETEWERRRLRDRLHLTFSGCLGPCAVGNNALLILLGRAIWFKDLNEDRLIPAIYDYAETMLEAGRVLPPPAVLRDHIFERYPLPPESPFASLVEEVETDDRVGQEALDPVCLMDVDPATAQHKLEYGGRTIYFCGLSCKRAFQQDPQAYQVK